MPRSSLATGSFVVALLLVSLTHAADKLEFNRDVRPILSDRCFQCHGPDSASRQAGLRLDRREDAIASGVLEPGDADRSELVRRVFAHDDGEMMPPPASKKPLTDAQKEILKRWVNEGAEYQPHWAFLPVAKEIAVPAVRDAAAVRHPIDAFVRQPLERDGWPTAPEAPKEVWLRRVTFDLTGLPPTIAELDAFLADTSPDAYDKVVDRLFETPAHAERFANDWLDLARYADTFGYQADRDMHVWPWRDWVIRAYRQNLPYRDFVRQQIAGDLLPDATHEQKLATTFNRLHRQTNEGGSVEEEFRVEYVADRVRTMGTAFLGLSLECSRCHDHKFDPILQKDFYSLGAFFDNIDESGLYSHFTETAPTPALPLFAGDQEERLKAARAEVAAAEGAYREACMAALKEEALDLDGIELPKPIASFQFEDYKGAGDHQPAEGHTGQGIRFGGDDAYGCENVPAFSRPAPFSLSLWVKAGEHQPRMVVAHRSVAAEDSAFRGMSLVLDSGVPVFSLVHFWPGNALQIRAAQPIPLNEWTHIAVTYDGGSRAGGTHLYVNGRRIEVQIVRDALTRDFQHRGEWGDSNGGNVSLQLGARFRDVGFRNGTIDELNVYSAELSPAEVLRLHDGQAEVPNELKTDAARRFPAVLAAFDALKAARVKENDLTSAVRQIMTMAEMRGRRETFLLKRGAYDARGEKVAPDTPAGILPFPGDAPRNRLGLAEWLVDERNPLTARVVVNRYWQLCFGRGLVATPEDFGGQGQAPSHPELLDWLARDFMNHGWDVRRLCRQIVLSATYRQSSTPADREQYASDPDNVRLARGPRHRLPAEQIRDAALAVSGLLDGRVGGPSVMPYQPAGLWEESGTGKSYSQSKGADLYRRSLYTFWRRTAPPPSMTAFDAPSREFCVGKRERTSTPLQALVLLNDPQYVEAARVYAATLMQATPDQPEAQIASAFRRLTSRPTSHREKAILLDLFARSKEQFAANAARAGQLVGAGEAPKPTGLDAAHHAALTTVVSALFNYDEVFTKR